MPSIYCYACGTSVVLTDVVCAHCHSPLLLYDIYQMQSILQPENGNGTVYRAVHRRLNVDLVVKQAPLSLAGYIRNEAKILQSLRRELNFTPHVYDFREDEHHAVLIMEYIDGQTLDRVHPQQLWPVAEVEQFLEEMLHHLEELHSIGIIHRDLKPQNIIRRPNRSYALIDFNIAKHKGDTTEYSGHTRRYAPPEQLISAAKRRGNRSGRGTDERSDLYSLAATTYELLLGQPPGTDPQIPSKIHDEIIPANVRTALSRMLASTMKNRPLNATEALARLRPDRSTALPKLRSAAEPARLADEATITREATVDQALESEADTAWAQTQGKQVMAATVVRQHTVTSNVHTASPADCKVFPEEPGCGRITGIAWSPVASELAIATARGIRVYNPALSTHDVFLDAAAPLRSIGYVGKGTALACTIDEHVYVYRRNDGYLLRKLPAYPRDALGAVVCAPMAQTLAVATDQGASVFNIDSESISYTCHDLIEPHLTVSSHTGHRLITVAGQQVCIWRGNPADAEPHKPDNIGVRPTVGLALTPDGRTLAVASESKVEIWRSRVLVDTLSSAEPIRQVALSPDGLRLAYATPNSLRIQSIGAKRPADLPHTSDIAQRCFQIAFDKDGRYLAIATPGTVKIWDSNTRRMVTLTYTDNPRYLAFTPDGELLASVGHDILVREVRNPTGLSKPPADRTGQAYHGIAFAQDGHHLAAACGDTITVWRRRSLPKNNQTFLATAVGDTATPSAGDSNQWRRQSARGCKPVQAHSLLFAPRSRQLDLMKIAHSRIQIWPVGANQQNAPAREVPLAIRSDGTDAQNLSHIYDIALAPSGRVAAASVHQIIYLWDINDDDSDLLKIRLDFLPNSVALSPNGQLLAAVSDDTLQIWDVETRRPLPSAGGVELGAKRVMFAPDNITLATTHAAELRIWRILNQQLTQIYHGQGHTDTITDVAFADDWRTFASASDDGTIRIWNYNPVPAAPPPPEPSPPELGPPPQLNQLSIFLCHVTEDRERILSLSQRLRDLGIYVWESSEIEPGAQWKNHILQAIEQSDIFIVCLSDNLIKKASFAHEEIAAALKIAEQRTDSIYIIPLRLERVEPPEALRKWQWVNYFDNKVPDELVKSLQKRAQDIAGTKNSSKPEAEPPKIELKKSTEINHLKVELNEHRKILRVLKAQIARAGFAHVAVEKILEANDRRASIRRIKIRFEELGTAYSSDLIDEYEE